MSDKMPMFAVDTIGLKLMLPVGLRVRLDNRAKDAKRPVSEVVRDILEKEVANDPYTAEDEIRVHEIIKVYPTHEVRKGEKKWKMKRM